MFHLFYGFVWLVAWLPLRVLYLFSDFCYLIVYYIVGYRKRIVRQNLCNSFPEKTKKEIRRIERKFYRYFCDTFVEAVKKMHISDKEMSRRMTYSNEREILEQLDNGKSIYLMTAHYGNWEWFSSFSLVVSGKYWVTQVYKKQKSKNFNDFMLSLRSKFHTVNIEKKQSLRSMIEISKNGTPTIFGMLSDQWPGRVKNPHHVHFLNQDTPVLTGTEILAKKLNLPVFFGKVSRPKRGYCHVEFIPITLNSTETAEFEITETYMKMLEEVIVEQPEYWLWSHNRWKIARKRRKK
jgi:Lauroyl/myristoyl acyltransferase